ncbi:unnamed protein product [Staurois parvus]|uniref:Uncharacterized protein n=1 Tax=Staurois parvus TaxID=386267 RepID=A0ABN9DPD4_9NEOB|nr:unnamed protein product [Staurois parvus]
MYRVTPHYMSYQERGALEEKEDHRRQDQTAFLHNA